MPIIGWTTYTTRDRRQVVVRTLDTVTAVALFSPSRITVELDLLDTETGASIVSVSNVIRGDMTTFALFADQHLELATEFR
ncbi:hypothetical protein CFP71_09895 [Amycolatopsis thailandensis]|uniref:Uncharacterized protein n=1 Tax=Amycolatopsis thailandensis TaxID=589330 RepID=A0A229SDQ8_9PSEU|nr:hypothetical protein [Amycolatopsis thailandensis]OXM57038.1 hypothetical protein CFP71_09895 [Amycolatopsis thailandensis]